MSDQAAPVLIHGDATPADIGVPAGLDPSASSESVFKAFTAIPDGAVETTPDPAPPAPTPDPAAQPAPDKAPDVPPEFLGITKEPVAPDPNAELLKERPKGRINHDNFEKLQIYANKKIEELTQSVAERDSKLAEVEASRGKPSEELTKQMAALQQERDDLSERLLRQAAQDHPDFQTKFVSREKQIEERLMARAKDLGADAEAIESALRSPFKRRLDILEGLEMSETAKGSLAKLMDEHDAVQQEKGAFLSQSHEQLTAWQKEQQAAAEAHDKQRSEVESRVFKEVSEGMRTRFAPFQRVEGNAAWNAQAEALEVEAAKYYNGQVPLKDLAEVVHYGLGARVLEEKIIPALRAQNKALSEENARLKVGQPSANGAQPNGRVGQPDQSHMTSEERAMDTFRRAQAGALNNGFEQFRP